MQHVKTETTSKDMKKPRKTMMPDALHVDGRTQRLPYNIQGQRQCLQKVERDGLPPEQ